ncbi:hypothetical protein L345_09141, partial [Ophiophagus hannah]
MEQKVFKAPSWVFLKSFPRATNQCEINRGLLFLFSQPPLQHRRTNFLLKALWTNAKQTNNTYPSTLGGLARKKLKKGGKSNANQRKEGRKKPNQSSWQGKRKLKRKRNERNENRTERTSKQKIGRKGKKRRKEKHLMPFLFTASLFLTPVVLNLGNLEMGGLYSAGWESLEAEVHPSSSAFGRRSLPRSIQVARKPFRARTQKAGSMSFAPLGLPATRLDEEPLIIPIQSIVGRRRGGVFLLTAEAFLARRPLRTADRTRRSP